MSLWSFMVTFVHCLYFVLAQIASGSQFNECPGPFENKKNLAHESLALRHVSLSLKLIRSPARRLLITYLQKPFKRAHNLIQRGLRLSLNVCVCVCVCVCVFVCLCRVVLLERPWCVQVAKTLASLYAL